MSIKKSIHDRIQDIAQWGPREPYRASYDPVHMLHTHDEVMSEVESLKQEVLTSGQISTINDAVCALTLFVAAVNGVTNIDPIIQAYQDNVICDRAFYTSSNQNTKHKTQ